MSSPELFSQTQQKAPREQHIEQHEWSNVSAQPRSNELPLEALQGNDGGVEQIFSCSRIITSARQLRRREDVLRKPSASGGRITGPRARPSTPRPLLPVSHAALSAPSRFSDFHGRFSVSSEVYSSQLLCHISRTFSTPDQD